MSFEPNIVMIEDAIRAGSVARVTPGGCKFWVPLDHFRELLRQHREQSGEYYTVKCSCGESSVKSTIRVESFIGPCCLKPGEKPRPSISLVEALSTADSGGLPDSQVGRLGDDE